MVRIGVDCALPIVATNRAAEMIKRRAPGAMDQIFTILLSSFCGARLGRNTVARYWFDGRLLLAQPAWCDVTGRECRHIAAIGADASGTERHWRRFNECSTLGPRRRGMIMRVAGEYEKRTYREAHPARAFEGCGA